MVRGGLRLGPLRWRTEAVGLVLTWALPGSLEPLQRLVKSP